MPLDSPVLLDGDDRFRGLVTRLRPSQLEPGDVAVSENGRIDENGTWQVREGYKVVSGTVLSTTNAPILQDTDGDNALILIANSAGTDTAAIVTNVCTVTVPAGHNLPASGPPNDLWVVNLAGFTAAGSGADINGNRAVTRASSTTFTFSITSADDTYTGGTTGAFKLATDTIAIWGACKFSDPTSSNDEYIIIAANDAATALKLSDLSKTTITYPAGETLNQEADLNQEFDKVMLRQDGATSWEWDGDLSGSPAFTKVATGSADQHKIYDTSGNTDIADGVATVTETGHGRAVGDILLLVSSDVFEFPEGKEVQIATVPGVNSFTFYVDSADATGANVVYSTKASLGGGYIDPPAAPWGVYHQRRSWLPYTYDSEASPATRNITDEIIASDILSHVYDPIGNQFRITGGVADFVVGIQPFDDDRLLVFNRNSIHYLKGVSGSLTDVETIELSREIGCYARKTIVTYANQVLFLSDSGVYAVSFMDEYNLRGTDLPLSEAVDSIIRRINTSAADKSVAVYHDNRYWLAVPLDNSTVPNFILIYNFLNRAWESLDNTNTSNWDILELIPARSGKVNELYGITTSGGVHKLDKTKTEKDDIANTVGETSSALYDIPARVRTRQYTHGSLERKKFNQLEAHFLSDDNFVSDGSVSVIVEDIDSTQSIGDLNETALFGGGGLAKAESGSLRARIGNPRGFGAQLEFSVIDGRPQLRAVAVRAVPDFQSTTTVT